jgi:hypothetical protein
MAVLRQAFNALTRLHSRKATLTRFNKNEDESITDIRITPSNFFRNLEGPSQIIVRGREFIIPVDSIVNKFSPIIKRGDKIGDTVFGSMAIDEVTEMVDFGGDIMAYRVRVE